MGEEVSHSAPALAPGLEIPHKNLNRCCLTIKHSPHSVFSWGWTLTWVRYTTKGSPGPGVVQLARSPKVQRLWPFPAYYVERMLTDLVALTHLPKYVTMVPARKVLFPNQPYVLAENQLETRIMEDGLTYIIYGSTRVVNIGGSQILAGTRTTDRLVKTELPAFHTQSLWICGSQIAWEFTCPSSDVEKGRRMDKQPGPTV